MQIEKALAYWRDGCLIGLGDLPLVSAIGMGKDPARHHLANRTIPERSSAARTGRSSLASCACRRFIEAIHSPAACMIFYGSIGKNTRSPARFMRLFKYTCPSIIFAKKPFCAENLD